MATSDKLVTLDGLKTVYDSTTAMTAPTEASTTASAAHMKGNYFILSSVLYQATSNIAIGDTIVIGTNCKTVPNGISGEVEDLNSATNAMCPPIDSSAFNWIMEANYSDSGAKTNPKGVALTDFVNVSQGTCFVNNTPSIGYNGNSSFVMVHSFNASGTWLRRETVEFGETLKLQSDCAGIKIAYGYANSTNVTIDPNIVNTYFLCQIICEVALSADLNIQKNTLESLGKSTVNVNLYNADIGYTASSAINLASGNTTGDLITVSQRMATGYVPVKGISRIIYPRPNQTGSNVSYGMAFYDDNKAFIPGSGQKVVTGAAENSTTNEILDVPVGAAYARFTFFMAIRNFFWVYNADAYQENDLQNRISEEERFTNQVVGSASDLIQYEPMEPETALTGGPIKGSKYEIMTITNDPSSAYKHAVYDVSNVKYVRIKTRRSNSSTYLNYVLEGNPTANNVYVIEEHPGFASSGYDTYTYTFRVSDYATKLYVMVSQGGASSYTPTVEKLRNVIDVVKNHEERIVRIEDYDRLTYEGIENDLLKTAKNTVMGLSRTAGTKLLNFAFLTDTHINGYGTTVTYAQPSINAYIKLCNEKYIDFGAFGGDMYSDYNLSHDEGLEQMGRTLNQFGDINIPLLITKGNHECNGKFIPYWDMSVAPEWGTYHYWIVKSDGRGYSEVTSSTWDGETPLHYSTGQSEGWDSDSRFSRSDTIMDWEHSSLAQARTRWFAHDNNIVGVNADPYGDYYYVDFENEKVRVVVLNGWHSVDKDGLEQMTLGSKQLYWIEHEALNFTTPSEWYVLFITHFHPTLNYTNNQWTGNGVEFYELLNTFITQTGGNVIGILHGHQHADTYYTKLERYSWLINFIGVQAGYTDNKSHLGTENAYRTSVFSIDPVHKKIYETKIGYGTNRSFSFVPDNSINVQWTKS